MCCNGSFLLVFWVIGVDVKFCGASPVDARFLNTDVRGGVVIGVDVKFCGASPVDACFLNADVRGGV